MLPTDQELYDEARASAGESFPVEVAGRLPAGENPVLFQPDIDMFRATQQRQDKAQSAGNGAPLSRAATPYWRCRAAPCGRVGKRTGSIKTPAARQTHWTSPWMIQKNPEFVLFSQKCGFSHIFADFLLFSLSGVNKIVIASMKDGNGAPGRGTGRTEFGWLYARVPVGGPGQLSPGPRIMDSPGAPGEDTCLPSRSRCPVYSRMTCSSRPAVETNQPRAQRLHQI